MTHIETHGLTAKFLLKNGEYTEGRIYTLRLSLGLLSQYIAKEPGLDVRDVAFNLVEPVSAPGRDDHHVSRLEFDRLTSLDPRRPVLRIGHGSARRIGRTAFNDVVNLRHVVTITFLRVHARVIRPIDSAANSEIFRWNDYGGLTSYG